MSKVLVDREGLAHELLAAAQLAPGEGISDGVARLVSILAQPAEAEGVDGNSQGPAAEGLEVVAYGMPNSALGKAPRMMVAAIDIPGDDQYGGQLWEPLIRQTDHLAALSAVTAERDRLRGLINSANGFQDALERERDQLRVSLSDPEAVFVNMKRGTIATPSLRGMIDLYGEVVNGDEAQLLEIAKLRAEVEGLRGMLGKSLPIVEAHAGASHMLEGFRPTRNKWDELVDGIRAAMAAKEA